MIISFTFIKENTYWAQKWLFAGTAIALSLNALFNPKFGYGIISPSEPHQWSMVFVLLFGIYIIRPPYYDIINKKQFILKLINSFLLVWLAITTIEGSWDLIYILRYFQYDTTGNLIYGVTNVRGGR